MFTRVAVLLLFSHLMGCMQVVARPQVAPAGAEETLQAKPGLDFVGLKPQESSPLETDGSARLIELGDFDDNVTIPFWKKIKQLDDLGLPAIWIKINSDGGSIYAGLELIQRVETLKTKVICVVDFRAVSMGMAFLESQACDERLMTKRSHLMAHEGSVGRGGNADQHKDLAQALDAITSSLVAMMAERMQMSEKDFWEKIRNRTWYLDYHEALKHKAVDGIADPKDFPDTVTYEIQSQMFLIFAP